MSASERRKLSMIAATTRSKSSLRGATRMLP